MDRRDADLHAELAARAEVTADPRPPRLAKDPFVSCHVTAHWQDERGWQALYSCGHYGPYVGLEELPELYTPVSCRGPEHKGGNTDAD